MDCREALYQGVEEDNRRQRMWRQAVVALVVAALITTLGSGVAQAQSSASRPNDPVAAEAEFFNLLNAERGRAGLGPLAYDANLVRDARAWSGVMAPQGRIFHTTTLGADTAASVPNWRRAGENVGQGWDIPGLHRAFVNSPGHYKNIVGDFTQVGIGVVYTAQRTFVTFRFAKSDTPPAAVVPTAAPVASQKVLAAQVRRLYLAFFKREPDSAGSNHWVANLGRGLPLGNIATEFVKSKEFGATYGSLSNRDFVTLVYRNVLGRAPDAAGHAYWTGKLANGMSRGGVMVNFSESSEFIGKTS